MQVKLIEPKHKESNKGPINARELPLCGQRKNSERKLYCTL